MRVKKGPASVLPVSTSRWPSTVPPRVTSRAWKAPARPWPYSSWSVMTAARRTWSWSSAKSAAAAPWSSSVVASRKKLLACAGLSSDAGGSPAALHVTAVRAGFRSEGMYTSRVKQGLLVAGLTMARPAALATGISLRATAPSSGPIIATTFESAMKRSTLVAPRAGLAKPPSAGASSAVTSSIANPSRVGWLWTKKRIPFSAGMAARLSLPVRGRSAAMRSGLAAGAALPPIVHPARRIPANAAQNRTAERMTDSRSVYSASFPPSAGHRSAPFENGNQRTPQAPIAIRRRRRTACDRRQVGRGGQAQSLHHRELRRRRRDPEPPGQGAVRAGQAERGEGLLRSGPEAQPDELDRQEERGADQRAPPPEGRPQGGRHESRPEPLRRRDGEDDHHHRRRSARRRNLLQGRSRRRRRASDRWRRHLRRDVPRREDRLARGQARPPPDQVHARWQPLPGRCDLGRRQLGEADHPGDVPGPAVCRQAQLPDAPQTR